MRVELIRSVPLFSTLSDDEFNQLAPIFVTRAYRKNQIIFMEEETGNYMYLVLSGKVKVTKAGSGGKETILAIHKSGDFFGEMSLLDGKTEPATVSAMEDAKIISVSGADFHKFLLHNEKVMLQIIHVLCARLRAVWQTQSQNYRTVEERIGRCLHELGKKHGIRDAHGTIIDLKITHQDLAEMVGTSRETVTRALARLRQQDIIEISNRRISILNAQALLDER
jgi:CRP/FNR family transcriptional regulator